MTPISRPGVYDLSMAEYRRPDNVDGTLSLSASDAIILATDTPAHLKTSWEAERKSNRKADLGTVIHTLALEPLRSASEVMIIDAADFKTKKAQELRDAATASGKTPILTADYALAKDAVRTLFEHEDAGPLLSGQAERSYFALDAHTGIYLKARPDIVTERYVVADIKSVGSVRSSFIRRRIYENGEGWFMQAPFHLDVVTRVLGHPPADYLWICVEQKPPHAVKVFRPMRSTMEAGARKCADAIATFARCVKAGQWPAYASGIEEVGLPDHAHYALEDEVLAEEERGTSWES